ncbi:lytic transglycosylase domain-containing protein [Caballeronia sp. LjRoot31]|uniref:lytic transglycosylase domain-containing protein n=1 Tax=Caballeronia sp. LjRoot31 TaxID=3342324 RepID=UPI003ECE27AB
MADKPILKILIDNSDFEDFRAKFAAYQEDLSHQKEAWQGSNDAVKILSSRFEDAAGSFDRLNKAAVNPKFSGESGVFTKFQKSSLETGKSWTVITKQIEKSSKGLNGLAREMLTIGKLSGVAGAAVGGAASLYAGTRKAASGLAADNAKNRQLNLKPGVADAYAITYKKFGASNDQLPNFAQAKVDSSLWQPLLAVGVTQDEIHGDDAEQLARTYLQKAGQKWNSLPEGPVRGSWLSGTHQDALGMDVASFNQAASYPDPADWANSDAEFAARRDKLALPQGKYDKGTDAEQDFETSSKEVGNALKGALVELAPLITTLTKKFADAISAFSKSGQLDMYIGDATKAFKELDAAMAWVEKLADKVSPQLPSFGNAGDALDDAGINAGHVAYDMGRLVADDQFQSNLKNFLHGHWEKISKNAVSVDGAGTGTGANGETFTMPGTFVRDPNRKADITMLERTYGMPPGYLAAEEQIESSGGTRNVNPKNPGVLGAMQFDQPTAEKYGVNRYSEKSSLEGGARYLADLRRKYGGDLAKASASFDGFSGLDRDIAEHGDRWRDFIGDYQKSGETIAYLNRLEAQGVDLNGNSGGHVGVGTVTAVRNIAGFHPDNQIIDTGSTAGGNQPPILSRPAGMGNTAVPTLNVNVSAPPGSSVSVTTAGLPH